MKSILSMVLFVLVIAVAVIRLEIIGRPTPKNPARLRGIHRILGYLAVCLILFISYSCLKLLGNTTTEASPRVVWHILFSSFILPVLFIKLLIIWRYKHILNKLFPWGISICLLLFGSVVTAPNYRFLGSLEGGVKGQDARVMLETKCTRCHSMQRIRISQKNKGEWALTVDRMRNKLPGWISQEEASLILGFLQNRHQELQE